MGYYSTVVIGCEAKAAKMLSNVFEMHNITPDDTFVLNERTYYKWDSIKWRNDFEDIAAIIAAFDTLDEEIERFESENKFSGYGGYGYLIMRVGEEVDDIESRGVHFDDCDMSISIDFPWEHSKRNGCKDSTIIGLLSDGERAAVYREVFIKNVAVDIASMSDDLGVKMTDDQIYDAAYAFVDESMYGRNTAYWNSIESTIERWTE